MAEPEWYYKLLGVLRGGESQAKWQRASSGWEPPGRTVRNTIWVKTEMLSRYKLLQFLPGISVISGIPARLLRPDVSRRDKLQLSVTHTHTHVYYSTVSYRTCNNILYSLSREHYPSPHSTKYIIKLPPASDPLDVYLLTVISSQDGFPSTAHKR